MWTRYVSETGSRLFLLLGQLVVLCFCFFYIDYIYNNNILPDKQAKDSFVQTQCLVADKELSRKGHLIHKYRANFLITYTVNGAQYSHWVSGNGLDLAYTSNQEEQNTLLTQYDIGGNYPCWFNPKSPQIALLVMRHSWLSTFPLIVPGIVSMITFYYLLKNVSLLLALLKFRVRETVANKKTKKRNNS